METTVKEKGNITIPASVRKRAGIKSGDKLNIDVKNGDIVLSRKTSRKYETRLITSPITGLPVLTSGPNAPKLTNERVAEILVDFP